MSDPFLESMDAQAAERGPFRTAEPTEEKRLERARKESFDRVRTETTLAMGQSAQQDRRVHRRLVALLTLSVVAFSGVMVMSGLGDSNWLPWICPAFAAVIMLAFATWKNRALKRAWTQQREKKPGSENGAG